MPITKSAKKALKVSKRKQLFNARRKNAMKDVIKKYKKLVEGKQAEEAKKLLPAVQKTIDKAMKRGVIKKNNAARKKSRLMKKLTK